MRTEALRREVPEEGHLGHPGTLGDRRRGRRVVAALVEQLEGGANERRARFGFGHDVMLVTNIRAQRKRDLRVSRVSATASMTDLA